MRQSSTLTHIYLLNSLFFSYHPTDPLNLHSFPTRRSSDLRDFDHLFGHVNPLMSVLARGNDTAFIPPLQLPQDRKSTRLNSSHTVISYAVFCLKKKKQKGVNSCTCVNKSTFNRM